MTLSRIRPLFLIALLALFGARAHGAGASSEATAPAATQESSAASPTVADTLTQAIASDEFQRLALARLERLEKWQGLSGQLSDLEDEFDKLAAAALRNPDAFSSIELDRYLRGLHVEAVSIVDQFTDIVRRLEHDASLLESSDRNWKDRTRFLEEQDVPAAVLERTRSITQKLQQVGARVREFRDKALLGLDHAVSLQTRIGDARALTAARQVRIDHERIALDQAPVWRLGNLSDQLGHVSAELRSTWRMQHHYLAQHGAQLAGTFIGILALACWLYTRRGAQASQVAQCGYGVPFTASLLVALVSLGWLAPNPPRVLFEALFLLTPLLAARVARRAVRAPIALTLYGIASSTILFSLRGMFESSAIANRMMLVLQIACVVIPLAIDLRAGRLQQALRWANPTAVRVVVSLVMVLAAIVALQAVFGFLSADNFMRSGLGSVFGSGLVIVTTALLLYGAALSLLATPVAQCLNSARRADPVLLRALRVAITILATGSVLAVLMGSLGLVIGANSMIDALMDSTLEVGSLTIAFRSVATAIAIVMMTFILTGIVGFILSREILPRLPLRAGSGYAIVTFTRWAMFIGGAVLSLAALGIDMAKITLLAGALSVGIGFGLQNVVNNFVSGLILIIERPISVGDVIEWGGLSGTVTRIGIRSSTVRTGQGAEILVPNGDLVSKEVVNWTRSDRQRRYDIDVGVALDSRPEEVMALLMAAAAEVPEIMQTPPPRVVFKGVSDTAMNFTLLAWVSTVDIGTQAQNAMRVAMIGKLKSAGIEPFSSRPVDVRAAGGHAPTPDRGKQQAGARAT